MTEGVVHTQVDGSFFLRDEKGDRSLFHLFRDDGFGAQRACGDTCGDKLHQLKVVLQEDAVLVVLVDAEVALCDLKGTVIVDVHKKHRLGSMLPGMVAEGLAKRMTADIAG